MAISVTHHANPFTMAEIRGRVVERLDGDAGYAIIDRISEKYTGQRFPLRSGKVAFLVEAHHARARTFG